MLTLKQNEFCKEVANGNTAAEAYRLAYKSTSAGTCKVNGSKMLKQPEISQKIQELQELNKKVQEKVQEKAISGLEGFKIATSAERQDYLTKIMYGEIKIPTTDFKWNAATKEFEEIAILELASHEARIKAIAELNKMGGDYAPERKDIRVNKLGIDLIETEFE